MARSRRTVTRTLVMLMLALTVPVTAFTVFVLVRYALEEQKRYERDAEQIASFVSGLTERSMIAPKPSGSTPRTTMGRVASARVATPDPVTVAVAAVTPPARLASAAMRGHWSIERSRCDAG